MKTSLVNNIEEQIVDVKLGQARIVAEGPVDDFRWGFFMFPRLYRVRDGRLVVDLHMGDDSTLGVRGIPVSYLSSDNGRTWRPADPARVEDVRALVIFSDQLPYKPKYPVLPVFMPDGEEIHFLADKRYLVKNLKIPEPIITNVLNPSSPGQHITDRYRLGDMPEVLQRGFRLSRSPEKDEWALDEFKVELPCAVLSVTRRDCTAEGWKETDGVVFSVFNQIFDTPDVLPDGSLMGLYKGMWCQSDGKIREKTGIYCVRSTDRGRTWKYYGTAGYIPDLNSPGLTEPHWTVMPKGSLACVMRSDKGCKRELTRVLYMARSDDSGRTWCKPYPVAPNSVKPRLLVLDNGIVALQYGRPGVHLLFCTDGVGKKWHTHTTILGPHSEDELPEPFEQTRYQYGCDNAWMVATGPDRFLIVYSDFLYRDSKGQRRKAIKVQEVIVTLDGNG